MRRSPDHAEAAKVTVETDDLSGGQISVTPCCEKVADEVRAIAAAADDSDSI